MDDLSVVPIIDAHLHMRQANGTPGLEEMLQRCGLRQVALQSIPSYEDEGPGQNIGGLLAKAQYPGRVFLFGGLTYDHPETPPEALDLAGQAQRLVAAGCDGIKMIEGKPGTRKDIGDIPLDSPLYHDCYALLEATGVPLLTMSAIRKASGIARGFPSGRRAPAGDGGAGSTRISISCVTRPPMCWNNSRG